jgi:putative tryptophan/tyrosine transport system substrate-binding protein
MPDESPGTLDLIRRPPHHPGMDRRRFLVTSLAGALAAPLAARAQHAGKPYCIGVLEVVGTASNALRELGSVEGQNLVIEYRSADGSPERFADLAIELVALKVDVIVTRGTPAAFAAKHATGTIPIVMASSGDPVAEGIVASLARPGGNVTGFHIMAPPELGGKRLQLLKEAVPGASRVGILWNSADIHSPLLVRETERVARAMGVQLKSLEMQRPWPSMPSRAFDQAFEEAMLGQVDALIAVEDYVTFIHRTQVVGFAVMSRLPSIYGLREFVEAGGLMSYGTDRRDLFRRSASYIDRILKGARPGDLPIEQPTKFELVINLRTAKALGLTIPPSLLARADQVIE